MSRHYQCFIYDQRNVVISIYPVRKNARRLETYAEIIFLIGLGSMTIMTLILSFELFQLAGILMVTIWHQYSNIQLSVLSRSFYVNRIN
jgi:hypothetical protein